MTDLWQMCIATNWGMPSYRVCGTYNCYKYYSFVAINILWQGHLCYKLHAFVAILYLWQISICHKSYIICGIIKIVMIAFCNTPIVASKWHFFPMPQKDIVAKI